MLTIARRDLSCRSLSSTARPLIISFRFTLSSAFRWGGTAACVCDPPLDLGVYAADPFTSELVALSWVLESCSSFIKYISADLKEEKEG